MRAAVHSGLVGSFLERDADATGVGLRLRIYAIALVFFVSGLSSLVSMLRNPQAIQILGVFGILAAVGLVRRNRTGLGLAVLLTIGTGILAAAAMTLVPNLLFLKWVISLATSGDLVSAITAIEIVAFALAVYYLLKSWWVIEPHLKSLFLRLALLFRVLAMIGAIASIAESTLSLFGIISITYRISAVNAIPPTPFVLAFTCVAAVLGFVYVFWSYGVLRGNATREYFGSSR